MAVPLFQGHKSPLYQTHLRGRNKTYLGHRGQDSLHLAVVMIMMRIARKEGLMEEVTPEVSLDHCLGESGRRWKLRATLEAPATLLRSHTLDRHFQIWNMELVKMKKVFQRMLGRGLEGGCSAAAQRGKVTCQSHTAKQVQGPRWGAEGRMGGGWKEEGTAPRFALPSSSSGTQPFLCGDVSYVRRWRTGHPEWILRV